MNMKQENNTAKSNIITLNIFPKGKPISNEALIQLEDEYIATKLINESMDIANKIDIKGFALVAWDEKGTPCISYGLNHPNNPISEFMLPTFTQTCFQSISTKRISTPEDLNEE